MAMSYDSFNIPGTSDHVQLKVGPCQLNVYHICDKVSVINDGVYLSDNGVIVITNGVYAAYHPHAIDKWGGVLDTGEIIRVRNPMIQALEKENLIPVKDEHQRLAGEWKCLFNQCKTAGFTDARAFELVKIYIFSSGKQ